MKEGPASEVNRFETSCAFTFVEPDDSLTIPKMALSIGFQDLVSLLPTIQATGLWLLPW